MGRYAALHNGVDQLADLMARNANDRWGARRRRIKPVRSKRERGLLPLIDRVGA